MKTIQKLTIIKKRNYKKPEVDRILLDNDISMVMQSLPPPDPDEMAPSEHFSINPFKIMKL